MRSPSGPPVHPPTHLGVCSLMAALLGNALWGVLTTGHPLRQDPGSFPLAFFALVLNCLMVLHIAALPRRPGEPVLALVHRGIPVWLPWFVAVPSLLLASSELGYSPWLGPLLLLPLAALLLAFLATRAHRRQAPVPAPDTVKRYPPSACQSFGTAALTAALLSTMLNTLFTSESLFQSHAALSPLLFLLVAVLTAQVLLAAAPVLPPRFSQAREPPVLTSVFVWIAWPMVPVSALPITVAALGPSDLSALWPFGLFPLGALAFAVLCTRAHRQERGEQQLAEGNPR